MARSHKARAVVVADFETTTDPADCRVWAWGIADAGKDPEHVEMGNSIESFIDHISNFNSTCYFHNLKFDGHFILDYIMKNGYIHTEDKGTRPMQFTTLISDMGMFYSMTVRWENGFSTEFRDSYKKLPMTVKRIAKSFGYDEGKGDIDYHTYRPIGHELTDEEKDYLRRDVAIVAKAIKQVHIDNGMKRLTVASDSLAEYKSLKEVQFDKFFPPMSPDMDAEIRRAYRGGFTYADPRFKGRRLSGGLVLDVNSLYPHIMVDRILPFGTPTFYEGYRAPDEVRPLTIFSVTFTAKIKPGHIPCIQIKGSSMFHGTEYLTEIKEPVSLMVTNVDWELYNAHYDIDVLEYAGGWAFKGAQGLFDAYVNKWARIKEHSEHGIREISKLHLNSLYGKFASNPNVTSKIPVLEDGIVKLRRGVDETRPPVYTAVGVFITSWARDLTIRAAQANYDTFAYADTDSLHLLTNDIPKALDVDPKRMGAWKLEYRFTEAYYIRAKAYLERKVDGVYHNAIAGLPEHISSTLTIDDLKPGLILKGKLTPRAVAGGVVLMDTPYELKLE